MASGLRVGGGQGRDYRQGNRNGGGGGVKRAPEKTCMRASVYGTYNLF